MKIHNPLNGASIGEPYNLSVGETKDFSAEVAAHLLATYGFLSEAIDIPEALVEPTEDESPTPEDKPKKVKKEKK